jgi:hypothetical protein
MEVCMGKLDNHNDRKICGMMPVNETLETSVTSTVIRNLSYAEQALIYRISCEILTPNANNEILLHR